MRKTNNEYALSFSKSFRQKKKQENTLRISVEKKIYFVHLVAVNEYLDK